jgi:hypothetical protein
MTIENPMTTEQILRDISGMRDSVWAIQDAMSNEVTKDLYRVVERNVGHLNIIMNNPEITGFGEDLSDIVESIQIGEEYLLNNSYILSSTPTE